MTKRPLFNEEQYKKIKMSLLKSKLNNPSNSFSSSKYTESLKDCNTSTLIEFFKENPDKLNDIIVGLRGDKIRKILGK